jgi:succinoglycan biosynthesis protein ExoV
MAFERKVDAADGGGQGGLTAKDGGAASLLRSFSKQVLAAPSTLALRQARKATPQLSADHVLADRKDRFREVLDAIRRDYF